LKRRITDGVLATAALLVIGCGGSSTDPSSNDARCRRYATASTSAITISNVPDATATTTCMFDRATATLRCTQTGSGGGGFCLMQTSQTVYASVADFVEEAAVVGRERRQRMDTALGGGCSGINLSSVYVYDGQKRPLNRTDSGAEANPSMTTFGAWDALGRPTTEASARETCTGETWAVTYDDAARRTTTRTLSAGTGRGCAPSVVVSTVDYDADGNITRQVVTAGGVTTRTQTNTITSAESVCR